MRQKISLMTKVLVFGVGLLSSIAVAQEESLQVNADDPKLVVLVEKLGSSSITSRLDAKKELKKVGATAIPYLKKAALSGKREKISHSISLLSEFHRNSPDPESKRQAESALKELAKSKQPSVAQRATQALNSKEAGGVKAFPGWNKPGTEFNGQNVMAGGENVSVSSVNGRKTIKIESGGQSMKLADLPGGKIQVEIEGDENSSWLSVPVRAGRKMSVRKKGDRKVVGFVATSPEDLKKWHPAAGQKYAQFGKGALGMPNFGGFPGFGKGVRARAIQQVGNGFPNFQFGNQNNGDRPVNEQVIRQLEETKKKMKGNPKVIQMLNQQIQELKKK